MDISAQRFIQFRVMTFNIWQSGKNVDYGIEKIAWHIQQAYADIVALQEVYRLRLDKILDILGPPWAGIEFSNVEYPDVAIISRFPLDIKSVCETAKKAISVRVNVGTEDYPSFVSIWSIHADYRFYGPYFACQSDGTPQVNDSRLMTDEASLSTRFSDVINMIRSRPVFDEIQVQFLA